MPLPDEFHAARMRGIDDRDLIDLGHVVDGLHQGKEVFLDVDVFLAVGADEDVTLLLQPQTAEHIALRNLFAVAFQHLAHGRAGDEDGLAVDAFAQQVTAAVLGVGQVDVADMIDDLSVDHLAHIPVPAAVAASM